MHSETVFLEFGTNFILIKETVQILQIFGFRMSAYLEA